MSDINPMAAASLALPANVRSLGAVLESRKAELAKVLPKDLAPDKLIKLVVNCVAMTPELQKCSIESVLKCAYAAAELGFTIGGPLGHAYMIPFGSTATFVVGYKGLVRLAYNSGEVASLRAVVVHSKDVFEVHEGLTQRILHKPSLEADPGPLTHVYSVATLRSGEKTVERMTRAQVDAIRSRSRSGKSGPWATDYEEMARKTVVKKHCKMLPLEEDKATALHKHDEDTVDGEVTESSDAPPPAGDRAQSKAREALGLPAESLTEKLQQSIEMSKAKIRNEPTEEEKAEIIRQEYAAAGEKQMKLPKIVDVEAT